MRCLAMLALCLPLAVHAGEIFNGYDAYYATLQGRLFSGKGHDLKPESIVGSNDIVYVWKGLGADKWHSVMLNNGRIQVDGKVLQSSLVTAFPDEVVDAGDLGRGSSVFFAKGWACLEGVAPSASGTAERHKSIYLIQLDKQRQKAWKLPSLFASCSNIRMDGDAISFDKVEYRYQDGKGEPTGVVFTEYTIKANGFVQVGKVRKASFIETGNVYKFSL